VLVPSSFAASSQLGDEGERELACPFELAVVWVRKARKGSTRWVDECTKRQLQYYVWHKRTKTLSKVVKFVLLFQAIFETPSWCLTDNIDCASERPGMLSFDLPTMPLMVGNVVEISCILFLLARLATRRALGPVYVVAGWKRFGLFVALAALVDDAYGIVNVTGVVPGTFRFSRLCRPFIYLAFTKPLRQVAMNVLLCLPKVADVLASLAVLVCLSVVVGIVLFANTDEGKAKFATWDESFASLWILFTTANFPDVMIPAINRRRSYFGFFFVYLVLTLFLLSNILLAAVYNAYKTQLKASMKAKYTNRALALKRAFALLANDRGEISREQWMRFFRLYTRGITATGEETEETYDCIGQRSIAVLRLLEVSSTRGMRFDEFRRGMDALLNKSVYFPRSAAPWVARPNGRLSCLHRAISGKRHILGYKLTWDIGLDVLIFAEMVGILLQSVDGENIAHLFRGIIRFVSSNFDEELLEQRDSAWFFICRGITALYVADTTLKIWVLGIERLLHRSPKVYRFDIICSYGLAALEVAYFFSQTALFSRVMTLSRMARSLRLFRYIVALRHLYTLLTRLLPTYLQLVTLLFLVSYIFATVGVQAFGGRIWEGNDALKDSDFEKGQYWALNFNDFASALMTLFVVMVVNNWYIIADGYYRVTGTKWACAYFVIFFVIANLIVLDILVAMILECYTTLHSEPPSVRRSDIFDIVDAEVTGEGSPNGDSLGSPNGSLGHGSTGGGSGRHRSSVLVRSRLNSSEMLGRVLMAEDEEFMENFNWLAQLGPQGVQSAGALEGLVASFGTDLLRVVVQQPDGSQGAHQGNLLTPGWRPSMQHQRGRTGP